MALTDLNNILSGGRIGIVFSRRELEAFARDEINLLLMLPGASFTEQDAARVVSCPVLNLNRYGGRGGVLASSREIAPMMRAFLAGIANCPLPARVCLNELYQYNLRLEFYFLHTLAIALAQHRPRAVVVHAAPYPRYISAERPDYEIWYRPACNYALLARRLCRDLKVPFHAPPPGMLEPALSALQSLGRQLLLGGFHLVQNLKKVMRARRDTRSRVRLKTREIGRPIGIIVRTDAEVVAALPVCRDLQAQGANILLVHDEMISSQTTLPRILRENLPYISVGGARGLVGLLSAWLRAPRRLRRYNTLSQLLAADSPAARVFQGSHDIWREMEKRALDFTVDQTHFALELDDLVKSKNLRGLVTLGFLDQWGPAVQECGDRNGIPTVCLQCTAQDLWEHPLLGWSRHYCCESIWLKNQLVALGCSPAAIVGTGQPHLMTGTPAGAPNAEALLARRKFVICTQPGYREHVEQIIEAAARVAGDHGFEILIKYHPRQVGTEYNDLIERLGPIARITGIRDAPIDTVLGEATIMLSVVSTTIARAIFLGVPVFSLWPVEEQHIDVYYVTDPVTRTADRGGRLETDLRACLADFAGFHAAYAGYRQAFFDRHAVFEPTNDIHRNVTETIRTILG